MFKSVIELIYTHINNWKLHTSIDVLRRNFEHSFSNPITNAVYSSNGVI